MKKPLDIYTLTDNDITTKIIQSYHPDMLEYRYPLKDHKISPTSNHWKRLLHTIYIGWDTPLYDDSRLAGLTDKELLQASTFLRKHDMISLNSPHVWGITQSGIDIALRNEEIRNDKNLKYWLVICSTISTLIIHFILII